MNKTIIYVGAGHSNQDPGACAFNLTEAGVVGEFRDLVAAQLRATGADVLTDGIGDENKPLREAIKLAQTAGPVRVEFHLNAASNPSAGGVECLSAASQSPLAKALCSTVANILQISVRGGDGGWKTENSGQHHRLGFISQGRGLILELFFISNKGELDKYQNNKEELAAGVANALLAGNV